MWESIKSTSHRGSSVWKTFMFVFAILIVAFLGTLLTSQTSYAATDASWNGSTIVYKAQPYKEYTADGNTPPGLSKGTKYYHYLEVKSSNSGVANIIYFTGTPATQKTAKYVTYSVNNRGEYGAKLSGPTDLSITPQSQSSSSTQVAWNGNDLEYDGKPFAGSRGEPRIADGSSPPGLAKGVQYYMSVGSLDNSGNARIYILSFPEGVDVKTATTVNYQVNSADRSGEIGGVIEASKSLSITPAADSPGIEDGTASGDSSCKIDGIGWIVCPVSTFLAKGMDSVFNVLEGFLTVSPLTTSTGSLYKAWSVMRSFANVAFVIAFIVIIYSQLTGMGISNYGIKKLLPRLILAAILVNVSYWICAIAVDISNILGSNLQNLLVALRDQLDGPNTNAVGSWESITGFLLAGGIGTAAAIGGTAIFITTVGGSLGAAMILILPLLLTVLLASLVALIVLAARQAVITLLIILAPLAFVAYLLPNTEKWFKKWKDTFMTLLIFFPLFALVFGGSQLASFLVIQTSSEINIILLGMFIQVAPLVLTPMLVKFSGSVVGRIAGIVNNPNKGFIDRTKKWSRDQSETMAARNMGRTDPMRRRQVFRRMAVGMDDLKRGQADRKAAYTAQADARWTNTSEYSDINQLSRQAGESKQLGESRSELRYQASKNVAGELRDMDIAVRDAKLQLENAKVATDIHWEDNNDPLIVERKLVARTSADTMARIKATDDAAYDEFKAGQPTAYPATATVAQMLHQNQHNIEDTALQGMRSASAQYVQKENRTRTLAADMDDTSTVAAREYAQMIRSVAGGIQGHDGAQRVLAQALSDQNKAREDTITNANAIIEHSNLSAEETLRIAQNISVKNIAVTDDIREAAIKRVASNGVVPHINELLKSVDMTSTGNEHFRTAIVNSLRNNGNKPKYIGLGLLDQMTQGIEGGIDDKVIDGWVQKMLVEGKLSAREMSTQDRDTLVRVNEAIGRMNRTPEVRAALTNLRSEISDLKGNDQIWNAAGERKGIIDSMDVSATL